MSTKRVFSQDNIKKHYSAVSQNLLCQKKSPRKNFPQRFQGRGGKEGFLGVQERGCFCQWRGGGRRGQVFKKEKFKRRKHNGGGGVGVAIKARIKRQKKELPHLTAEAKRKHREK